MSLTVNRLIVGRADEGHRVSGGQPMVGLAAVGSANFVSQ
jgi:hypothetical protein